MKIANPAQLTNFLWNEKNKFPLDAIKGSIGKGFEIDETVLFPWLMKFQQWLSDFNEHQAASQPIGAVWVKASERLPENEKRVIWKWNKAGNPDWPRIELSTADGIKRWAEADKFEFDEIDLQWLDESESPTAAEDEKDAFEFPDHETAWRGAQQWLWNNCKANEMGNYALHPSESAGVKGAVWVYTAKGLPKDGTIVLCEYKCGDLSHMEYLDCNKDWWLRNVHRWLNESPTAAGDGKEDAVEFAEWIGQMNYQQDIDGGWSYYEVGDDKATLAAASTAELYTIFKQSK